MRREIVTKMFVVTKVILKDTATDCGVVPKRTEFQITSPLTFSDAVKMVSDLKKSNKSGSFTFFFKEA